MEKIIRYGCVGVLAIAAIIASFSLPRRELQTIAQVAGIAIDEKDKSILATFEVFEPSVEQPYGKERSTVTSMGKTLNECIENARLFIGKELYVDDAVVLIIGEGDKEYLWREINRYYSKYKQDHMDLLLVRAKDQAAYRVFEGEGKILSTDIAESVRLLNRRSTIKEFFNGSEPDIFITGVGKYEIIS